MKYNKYASAYLLWMFFLIIAPLLLVIVFAFTNSQLGDGIGSFTLDNIKELFNPLTLNIYFESFKLAFYTTAIALVLGYIAAYLLVKVNVKVRLYLLVLFIVPMWMNMLLRTYAWKSILSNNGLLNNLLNDIGLESIKLLNTPTAVLIGMVYNFLPFMVLPIYLILEKMNQDYVNASYDLGASKIKTFLKITLPLSLPGVLSGVTMVFMPAASTFVIPQYLGGGQVELIGNVIERDFRNGYINSGSALSLGLIVVIIGIMLVSEVRRKNYEKDLK